MGATVETVGGSNDRKGRSNYPADFKRRLATAACEPGISVSKLAQQHGINANMLFKCRRDLRAGLLTDSGAQPVRLLPVMVRRTSSRATRPSAAISAGFTEIVNADAVVRVSAGTDAALLQLVFRGLRS